LDTIHLAAWRRSLTAAASRRGALITLGGLLATNSLALGVDEASAKKHRKNRKHRKHKRNSKPTSTRVDAICPGPTDNTGFTLNEGSRFAQTFTTLSTGRLVLAELLISAFSNGSANLSLELRDVDGSGVPANKVLAKASIDVTHVPDGESTVFFSFAAPPQVAANRKYALVLSNAGTRNVSWKGHRTATCDGHAFASEPSTEPFEPQVEDLDLIFTTIVSS
jgi:hypothetical protein